MNAREEFLEHINEISRNYSTKVLCVQISNDDHIIQDFNERKKDFHLTTGWTNEEWSEFLSDLDFEYDDGYGGQNLFGTIWYQDGTWSERSEYDGSEWWGYNKCPKIPEELDRKDKVRDIKLNQIL
jgi:hypothetical protein